MFQVDKSIPLPTINKSLNFKKQWRFPVLTMEVGDSFFAPGYVQRASQRMFGSEKTLNTSGWRKAVPGSKWTTRLVVENGVRGVRVWRVA